jgi:uncharacterized protein related to proFAR isomerase
MRVVPVIDLKGGVVVHARAGAGGRAAYRPIVTPLSPTPAPLDVVRGLLSLHPFSELYVADLDAIEGRRDHFGVVREILAAFSTLDLWLDAGCGDAERARELLALDPRVTVVLGTESMRDVDRPSCGREDVTDLAACVPGDPSRGQNDPSGTVASPRAAVATTAPTPPPHPCREPFWAALPPARVILSLDFRGEEFLGPAKVLADPAGWPDRLIVMDLARVGHASAGPDLKRLESLRKIAGGRELYLAGGLRGPEDFSALRAARATGILAASALHDGRVSAAALAEA